jgi:hypothetical protein
MKSQVDSGKLMGPMLILFLTVLWNRNRRNRNFLPCGTGTVTIYGSGTAIKW